MKPMARGAACALGALGLLCSACDEPTGPGDCPASVTVTVTSAPTPEFSWSPACHAAGLTVYRMVAPAPPLTEPVGDPVWSILSSSAVLLPPVTYGVSPFATPDVVPLGTLSAGVQYEVAVARIDYFVEVIGSAKFTIPAPVAAGGRP